jgi:hypothetical protein
MLRLYIKKATRYDASKDKFVKEDNAWDICDGLYSEVENTSWPIDRPSFHHVVGRLTKISGEPWKATVVAGKTYTATGESRESALLTAELVYEAKLDLDSTIEELIREEKKIK